MRLLGFIILLGIGFCAKAQPYSIDPNFQPYFNITNNTPSPGLVNAIWENPSNGRLFIVGDMDLGGAGVPPHGGLTQVNRNGSYVTTFPANFMSGGTMTNILKINDTLFGGYSNSSISHIDTFGSFKSNSFNTSYYQTVPCKMGYQAYFFDNGSALIPNGRGGLPTSCQIYSYNDTFPHQYIVKVNNQGFYDSTFKVFPNKEPDGFLKYDSNRILVFGRPFYFTHYKGTQVNGLCRIYLDGTLDTTFSSPLDNSSPNSFQIRKIDSDGSLFLVGFFKLKNDSSKTRTLVKLKPNGELDSTFFYAHRPTFSPPNNFDAGVNDIAKDKNGGYIVGGGFDVYQGYNKNSIVKVDSNGIIEPQYFNGLGPDSSVYQSIGLPAGVGRIYPSNLGGYYVTGYFMKWNGIPTQPIIRIHDQTTGLHANSDLKEQIKLYPNPSQDFIRLEGLNELKIRSIQVVNLLGQEQTVIWDKNSSNSIQVEVAQLKTGIYVIQLQTEAGLIAKKFIRQ